MIKLWNKVKMETVLKFFKKCSTSNFMDGVQNALLWNNEIEKEIETICIEAE